MRTVYKLMNPEMQSAIVGHTKYAIQYVVGLNVHPNMFVFETLQQAREYGHFWYPVWECETTEARKPPKEILVWTRLNYWHDEFWAGTFKDETFLDPPPEGTLLCNDLRVIRRV